MSAQFKIFVCSCFLLLSACTFERNTPVEEINHEYKPEAKTTPLCFEKDFNEECLNKVKDSKNLTEQITQNEVLSLNAKLYLLNVSVQHQYLKIDNSKYSNLPTTKIEFYPHSNLKFNDKKLNCSISNNKLGTSYYSTIYWNTNTEIDFNQEHKNLNKKLRFDVSYSESGSNSSCMVQSVNSSQVIPDPIFAIKGQYLNIKNKTYAFNFKSNDYGNIFVQINKEKTDNPNINIIKYIVYNRNYDSDSLAVFTKTTFEYLAISNLLQTQDALKYVNTLDSSFLLKIKLFKELNNVRIKTFDKSQKSISGKWYPVEAYLVGVDGNKIELLNIEEIQNIINPFVIGNNKVYRDNYYYYELNPNGANQYLSASSFDSKKTLYEHKYQNLLYLHNKMTSRDMSDKQLLPFNSVSQKELNSVDDYDIVVVYLKMQ